MTSLQDAQNQQHARPENPQEPLIPLAPSHASHDNIVAQPPLEGPPSRRQQAEAGAALGLDGGRAGDVRIAAAASIAVVVAVAGEEPGGAGGEAEEDAEEGRGEGGDVGDEGVAVDGLAAEEDVLLGEGEEVVWPAHG